MYCIPELVLCTASYSLQVLLQERQEGGEIVLVGVGVPQTMSLPGVDLNSIQSDITGIEGRFEGFTIVHNRDIWLGGLVGRV